MSTKRDLVEAHAFSRRRLVTAFVSGAPGGREVEPVRPGRAIVGGVALAVLLLAGAAIAGVFSGRAQEGWRDPGMIIAKETGAGYVIVDDDSPIQPVVNTVSAQLIFGGELDPKSVPLDEINAEELGDPIGIFGAPESLPTSSALVTSGWTACTDGGGLTLRIQPEAAAVPAPGSALLVGTRRGAPSHLVVDNGTSAYRLQLPRNWRELVSALGLTTDRAIVVPATWLDLFPPGPALDLATFGAGSGPTTYDPSLRAGSVVTIGASTYLLRKSDYVELDEFAAQVYSGILGTALDPRPVEPLRADSVTLAPEWPSTLPQPLDGEGCAILAAEAGEQPRTLLATDPADAASAEALDGRRGVSVEPRYGAYVLTAGHFDDQGGTPWVVDSQGTRYHLGGAGNETADLLGYGGVPVPTIPEAWIEPLGCGPELSQPAALAAPESTKDPACASS